METSEEQTTASDGGSAAFEAAFARVQAARGETDAEAEVSPLSEALTAAGVEHTTKPKEEVAEAASEGGEDDGYGDGGLDALVSAMDPRAEGAQRRAQETASIESEARELGFSDAMVKHLANNTPRKNAREILAAERQRLQSASAVQSAPPVAPPVEVAPPGPALRAPAEVMETLRESLGDEAAQAVAEGVLSPLLSELQALKAAHQSVQQSVQQTQVLEMRSQVLAAAGELAGQFPQLVRGQQIDPAVSGIAADLIQGETFSGNVKGALEAAARLVYGSAATAPRQAPPATNGPDTSAPPALAGASSTEPISGPQIAAAIADIGRKHRNDPAKYQVERDRLMARVKEHNARVPRR